MQWVKKTLKPARKRFSIFEIYKEILKEILKENFSFQFELSPAKVFGELQSDSWRLNLSEKKYVSNYSDYWHYCLRLRKQEITKLWKTQSSINELLKY